MKRFGLWLTEWSLSHPRLVVGWMAAISLFFVLGAGLPSIAPRLVPWLPGVKVDTDPENMLARSEGVRVFHNRMKEAYGLHDMVVVGVVNEAHPDGVFNVDSLGRVYELVEFARTLRWTDAATGVVEGVVEVDLLAPSTVDNIEPGGPGVVRFEWLMPRPPATAEEARAIRRKAKRLPFLDGTLVSEDGQALCIYLPLTSKHLSYRVYSALREQTARFDGEDRFLITGLPVAEDTFGVEMFRQMSVSAPLAMLVIFLLLLAFFRKLALILSPLVVALVSVIWTMGLLVMTGNTIHIMSSMIPIFLMPIAVLDAVHILSMFFDRYQQTRDRVQTVRSVMGSLFMAMLYTSLTTVAGFASLALTPIPPVQVFGLFSAFGIMVAWALTVTFIPAFVTLIPEEKLADFGTHHVATESGGPLAILLRRLSGFTYHRAWSIVVAMVLVSAVAVHGITRIRINDNPTRWFSSSHPIRVADRVLNEHFGGTYMAYLAFEAGEGTDATQDLGDEFAARLLSRRDELAGEEGAPAGLAEVFDRLSAEARAVTGPDPLNGLRDRAEGLLDAAPDDRLDAWDEALLFVEQELQRREVFKDPDVLRYLIRLQETLAASDVVGKSNSLADVVRTVHRELFEGQEEYLRIPDSAAAVAQCLITYQSSHRPHDLWHFVRTDYRGTVLWLQLRSGDNRDMDEVVRLVDAFIRENPPPVPLTHRWFGLTYINVVWQQKMVQGMLSALLGSFLVVFLMMTVLFRSAIWGFLCMLPLSLTIVVTYGAVGLVGKDYDMPVAVLSSLSLGLAVDFAIHFLEHSRALREKHGNWEMAVGAVFGEPARAIWRNIVVIAVGFLPLLFASLVPYKTVGMLMATILVVAGMTTLLILPALMRLLERQLFPEGRAACFTCNCVTCAVSAAAAVALVVISVYRFLNLGWTSLTAYSIAAVILLVGLCRWSSRRQTRKQEIPR
ncbi:MAG: MMPL family transporter [Lentisphaeria bacterium]|nr:MMPL family transporter [Lentisphaeria bacterium]